MASIKALLRTSKIKKDGSCPIVIRIVKDRKTTFKFLGYHIQESQWDEKSKKVIKSHPNSVRINSLIAKKVSDYNKVLLNAENENKDLTRKQLKAHIKHPDKSSFKLVAQDHLSDLLKLNKFNQHSGEKPRVDHFMKFIGEDDISFQQITISLLKKFVIYLKAEKGLSERSAQNCLVVIRTVFNKAIADGLVDHKFYPFGLGKLQIKFPESIKTGLSEEEVRLLETTDYEPFSNEWNALNIWLTSFYLAGVRFSDIVSLKWKDFNDGRLAYIMGKNKKVVSLKLPSKVNCILEKYNLIKVDRIFVFPYLENKHEKDIKKLNSMVRSVNSKVNKYLKRIAKQAKIEKKITMHISRHTFGSIAGEKISPLLLQKLYRHSDLKTTIGYQSNFINRDVDGALADVLNF